MLVAIQIPKMGESISKVTIGTILRPSGSIVRQDDEILEIETDKVNQVLYAPENGTLHLNVQSQDVVDVGTEIGHVDTEAQVPEKKPEVMEAVAEKLVQAKMIQEKPIQEKLIEEMQVEEKPLSEKRVPLSPLRKVIGQRLVQAQKETASLTTFNEVNMTEVLQLRTQYKDEFEKKHGVKLGLMSFFVKATVSALEAYPIVGACIDKEMIVYKESLDISIAVATDRGLVVPVLRDCKGLSFAEIEQAIKDFALRAKEKRLSLDELQGGIFTITNGGVFGSLLSTPILNLPQSAILGMHAITKRAHVVDDTITICPMMNLALTYDHRLIDGKEAVLFLAHIKNCIEDPRRLELGI